MTQVLGYSALVLILAEGGLTTSWSGIRDSVAPAAVLSTLGVLVSVGVVSVAGHYFLHVSWTIALLIGAVLSSTDAAAVFSVLRRVPLPRRVTGMLEAESGFNDAPVVLLVVDPRRAGGARRASRTRGGSCCSSRWPSWSAARRSAWPSATAAAGCCGWSPRPRPPCSRSASLALTVLAYAVASLLHTSGFIATYLAALVLGNTRLPHRPAVRSFAQALGWLAQIGLFVMLGLLASPANLTRYILPALGIGLVLLLLARPASVIVSMTPFRVPWREQAFLSWAGLRGAVPVVLATVPLTAGTPGVEWLFDFVFVLVVIFTIVQGPTLPWVARRLGLSDAAYTVDVEVESTPLEEMGADLLQVQIGSASHLHGVELFELRLPAGANVTLVVRDDKGFVPTPNTPLRRGDQLLIVTTAEARRRAEQRVREVSERGRLAGWPVTGDR